MLRCEVEEGGEGVGVRWWSTIRRGWDNFFVIWREGKDVSGSDNALTLTYDNPWMRDDD